MYGGKSKSIGLACSGKEIYHFCFVLLCIRGQIPRTSPPGGLYSEERFNGGFFALRFWGAYIILEGLIHGGAYFQNFTVTINSRSPWEMISGFNLTATRREKRQGMKLCSGLRMICDSS